MPQMSPLSWLTLFLFFLSIFFLYNIMNYFIFNYSQKNSKKIKNLLKFSWKW